LAARWWRGRAF